MLLGVIADDFTGASDIASFISRLACEITAGRRFKPVQGGRFYKSPCNQAPATKSSLSKNTRSESCGCFASGITLLARLERSLQP